MELWMKNLFGLWSNHASGRAECSYLVNTDSEHSIKYKLFKAFLEGNYTALHQMSQLEEIYYGEEEAVQPEIAQIISKLLTAVGDMIDSIQNISGKYIEFNDLWPDMESKLLDSLDSRAAFKNKDLVLSFQSIRKDMAWFVGGKATNLAALRSGAGIPAPDGFAVTARAYFRFLEENGLEVLIQKALDGLDTSSPGEVEKACRAIRHGFDEAVIPDDIEKEIAGAMNALEKAYGKDLLVAVRSSAVGEDGAVSFAGQYDSHINVASKDVAGAYKMVLASKYNPGALVYRKKNRLSEEETPMCVAVTIMVRADASGVMYTADPASGDASKIKISAGFGFGERIVSGEDAGDDYHVQKDDLKIVSEDIARKEKMLIEGVDHKPTLMDVPDDKQESRVLTDDEIKTLARYGLNLEKYFRTPQDVEWVKDPDNEIFIVQSRPLGVSEDEETSAPDEETFIDDHPLIMSGGKTASRGRWTGRVYRAENHRNIDPPRDSILVTRTASPGLAAYLSKVGGVITDMGSVTSHLASVAREYGVPALFDMKEAFSRLENGQEISLDATGQKIYLGRIDGFSTGRGPKSPVSPTGSSQKLKILLDMISPLNLTDPDSSSFSPEGCRTVHDVIRFLHEKIITEMFDPAGASEHGDYAVLKGGLPLEVRFIDLGEGLADGLTTCDHLKPEDIRSIPMLALWRGLSHPGISWSGTIDFNLANLGKLMTTPEAESMKVVETKSYALVAGDYMNLSIKFGYHYANIEALCTERPGQNMVNFQFSGGAGGYLGRSLRILFLAEILEHLEFETDIQGDFLGASLKGFDCDSVQKKLDHMGRLMACSRLLDMVLKNEEDVDRFTEKFIQGNYDFLSKTASAPLHDFHVLEGYWHKHQDESGEFCVQDGGKIVDPLSKGLACLMGRVSGDTYRSFLDRVKAYHYFPLAIARDGYMESGTVQVRVRCVDGCIDMAAGLVAGLKNKGDYLVFRVDALKRDATLFHVKKGELVELESRRMKVNESQWYLLQARAKGSGLELFVDKEKIMSHEFEAPVTGHVGLWSKSDSVTHFDRFSTTIGDKQTTYEF